MSVGSPYRLAPYWLACGSAVCAFAAPAVAIAPADDASLEHRIDDAAALASQAGQSDAVTLAALLRIDDAATRAKAGYAESKLRALAAQSTLSASLRTEAALLAESIEGQTNASTDTLNKAGLVRNVAILGPFRDTGGGLARREGPEANGVSFTDSKATYSWGTVEVAWRKVAPEYSGASGVPLDVFVHPRKESCSYIASRITLKSDQPVVVRLAASGQARLSWDGAVIAEDESVMGKGMVDRLAARLSATAGAHIVAAKVCSGALADSGRVRLRLETPDGAAVAFESTAELGAMPDKSNGSAVRVITALEAALKENSSSDLALAQATVRTLGGADDLRSPKAQGILDALLQNTKLSARTMALAAMASPGGAPRSSALHAALKKAREENDKVTIEVLLRELIRSRLSMPDWAIATARSAGLANKTDMDAILLQAEVEFGLGSDALRLGAYRTLLIRFRSAPKELSSAILERLLTVAGGLDRAAAREVATELVRRGHKGSVEVNYVAPLGAEGELARAAERAYAGNLRTVDEGLTIARQTREAGDQATAAKLLIRLATFAPNRADVWQDLSQATASKPFNPKYLERARRLDPTGAQLRAEAELRATPEAGKDDRDLAYLRPSSEVLKKRQGVPKGPTDVADRELYWLRAVSMHADNRVSQLIHYAREIVIAPRTQDELNEDLPQEGDLSELLRARVHRVDGGIAYPTEEANDGARPHIRWPELRPGDVVEVALRTYTSGAVGGRGDSPFYFMDYAGAPSTHPLLYNEVVVDSPTARPIHVDVLNGGAHRRTDTTEGDRHVTKLVWDEPIKVPDEPLSPPLSELVPMIVGSTFADWTEFRTWYKEAVKGFTEPDLEVQRIAKELTKGKITRDDKVRALFNFVADDIRYVNYVSGEWWLPNRPQQLLARREGDCDDKAILLIALLRAVGVEAEEVLVQTRMTNMPTLLQAKHAAIPLFDHGIAFLPGPNGGQYLDATSPQSRLGALPAMDARASAILLTGPAEVVQLPNSPPDQHGAQVKWLVTLGKDGSADIDASEMHRGDSAFWLRSNLREAEARAGYIEQNLVSPWVSMVTMNGTPSFDGDLKGGQASVGYKAHSSAYARRERDALVVPLTTGLTLAAQLAPLSVRTLPVELPPQLAPSFQERELTFRAPVGFVFEPAPVGPEGGEEDGGEFGRAKLTFKRSPSGRELTVTRRMAFDASRIPVAKYAAFRGWLLKVDALNNRELRLLPQTKPNANEVH